MKRHQLIVVFIVLLFVVLGAMLIPYFWKFHFGFADRQGTYGEFGDYVGGILSPIIALVAAILVYDLSKQAIQSQEKTSSQALTNERKVLLMRMQYEEINEFRNKVLSVIRESDRSSPNYGMHILAELSEARRRLILVIPELSTDPLIKEIELQLTERLEGYFARDLDGRENSYLFIESNFALMIQALMSFILR